MKLELKLYDSKGQELKIGDETTQGDIVSIYGSNGMLFFCEVKYLVDDEAIAPMHTFSFHNIYKIDKLPDGAILLDEKRYRCWMLPDDEKLPEDEIKRHTSYLIEWRECEALMRERVFRVKPIQSEPQLNLFE